ncbi:hypothetical protein CROQUDRAFT_129901 [Cronartium quercuum f. sp. fusiforme G11]|uniref:Uncharacterized protein n=1 Tax=Cronartium quercuum f. sp. fusiforme G11 TaxID=708437 RepID=A0A9P6NWU5_9BASI|nr:hypothetical protein CROQUDRAFT_129901 [Cronartium quercuum f. sp. fusiforme G11]
MAHLIEPNIESVNSTNSAQTQLSTPTPSNFIGTHSPKSSNWMEDQSNKKDISFNFANDQELIDHILKSRLEPFLDLQSGSNLDPSHPNVGSSKIMSFWRLVDPRKPNRHRKLLERTKVKLDSSTPKQVQQVLLLNSLLDTLTNYNTTLARFQSNSLNLHRCLIKWDRLKGRDLSFSRTSLAITLDLQRFMTRINMYYPTAYLSLNQDQGGEEEVNVHEPEDEVNEIQGHALIPTTITNNQSTTNSIEPKKIGIRTHLSIRYKLHRLRKSAKTFNQQFRQHENEKMELKLRGNQCIFDMVKDGKNLLEINDCLVKVVLDLVIFSKKS